MNRRKCIPALLILVISVILSNGIPPLNTSESLNQKYSWLKVSKNSMYQLKPSKDEDRTELFTQ